MSDLIDLNSPEDKRLRPELPSPLIPVPDGPPKNPTLNVSDSRRSLENNPFDMVLRKTSEYVSKASDPFEIVFETATKVSPESHLQSSANFADLEDLTDFTDHLQALKRNNSDILKLNKTLDESLLNTRTRSPTTPKAKAKQEEQEEVPDIFIEPPSPANLSILDQSAMNDSLRSFSLSTRNPPRSPEALDRSILNNSAMNDTLSTSEGSDDCFIKSLVAKRVSLCIQKGTLDAELDTNEKSGLKNPKLRRSFSQGDRLSPRKFRTKRTVSSALKNSDQSIPSILFEDPLNVGFINREKEDYSICDLSELSNITRLNSVNSGSFFSAKSGNDSLNRAFFDSGERKASSRGEDNDFKDLLVRFNSLRTKIIEKDSARKREELEVGDDSVFLEEASKKGEILSQANVLAKTFEDLAEESKGSSSSGENLFSTRLPHDFAFSPEASVPEISSKASPKALKREAAAHLLRDLEKVVKTEDNPEIMKLLKNLESALGVKSKSALSPSPSNTSKSPSKIPIASAKNPKSPQTQFKSPAKNSQFKFPAKNPPNYLNSHETENSNILDQSSEKSPKRSNSVNRNNKTGAQIQIEENGAKIEIEENLGKIVMNQSFELQESPKLIQNNAEIEMEENGGKIQMKQFGRIEEFSDLNENESSTEDNTEAGAASEDAVALNLNTTPQKPSKVIQGNSQDSFSTQKLILDIQLALGKLLEDCKDEPALVLENLNKVLTPASKKSSPRKLGLGNRSLSSLGAKVPEAKPGKSFLRRRSSVSAVSPVSSKSSTFIRSSVDLKESAKPQTRTTPDKKRSLHPGLKFPMDKKSDPTVKIKSTLPVSDRTKLRKKAETSETKRGPMKALVPMGIVQKAPGTPPKRMKIPSPLKIATSTPDPSPIVLGKKCSKVKPVAASTPDIPGDKRGMIPSPKSTMSWNISPVTPNAKGNASTVFAEADSSFKADGARGPQTPKKVESGKRASLAGGISRLKDKIIRGRRSVPVQSPRSESRGGDKLASPLKESNSLKGKPLNLSTKFRRSGSLGNFQKENKV